MIGLLVLLRFIVTANDEILIMSSDPTNYARLAVHYLTNSDEDRLPSQRPGIGLAAKLSTAVGIPYKSLLDIVFVVTVYLTASLTRRRTKSTPLGLLTFATLAFHPWFLSRSTNFMGEPASSPLYLLLVAGLWPYLVMRPSAWRLRYGMSSFLAASLLVAVRPENLIVYGLNFLFLVVVIFRFPRDFLQMGWRGRASCGLILLLPSISAWGTVAIWNQVHLRHYRVAAMCITEMPGMHALMNALYTIEPQEHIRYAPVTKETLRRACDECHMLNQYRDRFLDESLPNYYHFENRTGVTGEVGAWLNWHVLQCMGWPPEQGNAEMMRAAQEIRLAQAEQRLPKRWARFPIDPYWNSWKGDLWPAFADGIKYSALPHYFQVPPRNHPREREVNAVERGWFDEGLMRRKGSRSDSTLRVFGYSTNQENPFNRVRFYRSDRSSFGNTRIFVDREGNHYFNLEMDAGTLSPDDRLLLEYFVSGESTGYMGGRDLPLDSQAIFMDVSTGQKEGIEEHEAPPIGWSVRGTVASGRWNWRGDVQDTLGKYQFNLLVIVTGLAFLSGLFQRHRLRRPQRQIAILIIGWGFVLGRCLFYTLIEVWLFWGLERYISAHSILCAWLLVLTAFYLGSQIRCFISLLVNKKSTSMEIANGV